MKIDGNRLRAAVKSLILGGGGGGKRENEGKGSRGEGKGKEVKGAGKKRSGEEGGRSESELEGGRRAKWVAARGRGERQTSRVYVVYATSDTPPLFK